LSSFLNIGVIFAVFQDWGILPVETEDLNIIASGGASFFRTLGWIPSGPGDLDGFRLCNSPSTSLLSMLGTSIGYRRDLILNAGRLESAEGVNTLEKNSDTTSTLFVGFC